FCDPILRCQHVPVRDGSSCADGDACDGDETCRLGQCTGGAAPTCDDGNPCTVDRCSAGTGCEHQTAADGTSCEDGDACNGSERCDAGTCTRGPAPVCNDGNACTADSCDPATGCHA